ncbi:MAG: helix-hairpin-helix domain-containing protein [Dysgonamonadaceae bacterium]|jgi:competence ComEA-like helix-hairpin-helix protein|nr:helix-hairpin-helix domain-containing protein [Dysgonamonadaceae bacterium]
MWKDFFYFSKRERRGILFLIVFIAGIFLGKYLFTPKNLPPVENLASKDVQEKFKITDTNQSRPIDSTYRKKPYYPPKRIKNNTSSKRTYYSNQKKQTTASKQYTFHAKEKISEGTVLNINQCDTSMLMKIPGIGSSFAKRISSYRDLLGGFYRIEQLQEVYGMYEELYVKIIPYLKVESDSIRTIAANSASLEKLKSHPYINFYQAKAIVKMRKKRGKLENIGDLSLLEEFSSEDLERINPYLTF